MKLSFFGILILFILAGCGDKKFDGTQNSVEFMMNDMTHEEQVKFIKDFELVSYVLNGEKKLIGYNVEDIKNEAINIKKFANNKNIKFLEEKIIQMQSNREESTYLHINYGVISSPKHGYIYSEEYSTDDLKDILVLKGDLEDHQLKKKEKNGFFHGCLKIDGITAAICECIWTDLITNYSNKELAEYSINPTENMNSFLRKSATNCLNKVQEQ